MPLNSTKIFFTVFVFFCILQVKGQFSADQYIHSSSGGFGSFSNNQHMSWTIGEVVIHSGFSNYHFTQGFHQPGFVCNLIFDLSDSLIFCGLESVDLTVGNYTSYLWNTGDTTQTIQASSDGSYSIEITDSLGCTAIDSFQLLLHDLPLISSSVTQFNDGSGGDVELNVSGNPPFLFDWDVDGTGDFDDFQDQFDLSPGSYQVIVLDDNGCVDTIDVFIDNEVFVFIPTGISPNADGVNDTWEIQGINSLEDFQIKILNRWGNVMYSSKNEYVPWDGVYKGSRVPTSDYYYVIELFSLNKVYTGTLTVRY